MINIWCEPESSAGLRERLALVRHLQNDRPTPWLDPESIHLEQVP